MHLASSLNFVTCELDKNYLACLSLNYLKEEEEEEEKNEQQQFMKLWELNEMIYVEGFTQGRTHWTLLNYLCCYPLWQGFDKLYLSRDWIIVGRRCPTLSWQIFSHIHSVPWMNPQTVVGSFLQDVVSSLMVPRGKGVTCSWHRCFQKGNEKKKREKDLILE